MPTAYTQGSSFRNAWAPSRPSSSPSVNRKMTSLRERRAGAQRARRLEEADHAAAVVGGTGGRRHRVVVRDQQQRARRVGAGQATDDVVDGARDPRIERGHDLGGLDVRREVQAAQSLLDEPADLDVARRAERVRSRGDDAQQVHGARRREGVRRRRQGARARRAEREHRQRDGEDDDADDHRREQEFPGSHPFTVAGGCGFATSRSGRRLAREESRDSTGRTPGAPERSSPQAALACTT